MSDLVQNMIVIAIILAAGGYLAVQGYRLIWAKKRAGCGGCKSCPSDKEDKKDLVQIKIG